MENNSHKRLLDLDYPPADDQPQVQALPESVELRAGDLCPKCRSEHLDYDGLLNLSCPRCGFALVGCST
jgi:hypothetical protein